MPKEKDQRHQHQSNNKPTHYDVLSLDPPHSHRHSEGASLSKEEVKAAYRRALLRYHPDKTPSVALGAGRDQSFFSPSATTTATSDAKTKEIYSIDEIVLAYETLLDPTARVAYDQSLLSDRYRGRDGDGDVSALASHTHIGVEVFDLDDLRYDEEHGGEGEGRWTRGCRCGEEGQGYILTEADLERESAQGEIYVGCRGCSLFIKVLFAAAVDEEQDQDQDQDHV